MSAPLAWNGAEHEGAGVAAVRAAMELGVRVPMRAFLAVEQAAAAMGDDAVLVVFDAHGGFVVVYEGARRLPLRSRRDVGERLRAGGFRRSKKLGVPGWELQVERAAARSNPRKPQPQFAWDFWFTGRRGNAYLLRIHVTREHAYRDRRHGYRYADVLSWYDGEWTYMPGLAQRRDGSWGYTGRKAGMLRWRGAIDAPPPAPRDLDSDELRAQGVAGYLTMAELYEEFQRRRARAER